MKNAVHTLTFNDETEKAPVRRQQSGETAPLDVSSWGFEEKLEKQMKNWSTDENENIFWGSGKILKKIPAGLYKVDHQDRIGVCLLKQLISTDELFEIEDSDSVTIIKEIENFWKLKNKFIERKLLHKRGILLTGDPGSGKTSTIQLIVKRLIEKGGIVIYPYNLEGSAQINAQALQMVRRIEFERPVCVIMEDFETMVSRPSDENEWLSILDGESQVNNILFLATTNYIEKLDKRLTDRPSRFDLIKLVKMPNREMRKIYLNKKEPTIEGKELEYWLDSTDGFSLAHLREIIISVKIFGYDLEETVERMNKMRDRKFSSNENLTGTDKEKLLKVGFGN